MQLQDYIETIMLDFINKRSKIFNFKTFKIAFATINSKIVTSSLLLNLYSCYKRFIIKEDNQLNIPVKDVMISRNMAFERVKQLNARYVES